MVPIKNSRGYYEIRSLASASLVY